MPGRQGTIGARSRAIDPALFDWPASQPGLRASLCGCCGRHVFPVATSCKACGRTSLSVVELPRRGRLWTWTIQRFRPKPPYRTNEAAESFTPFGVGYVEFPGLVRVEARLAESDPQRLRIGMPMELVFYPHCTDPDGTVVINYAFRCAEGHGP